MSLFYVLLSNPLDSRLRGNDIVVYMIMLVVVLELTVNRLSVKECTISDYFLRYLEDISVEVYYTNLVEIRKNNQSGCFNLR